LRYSVFIPLFLCTIVLLAIIENYLVSRGLIDSQSFKACIGFQEVSMCSTYGRFNCSVFEKFSVFFGFGKYIVKLQLMKPINVSIAYVDSHSHACRIIHVPMAGGEYVYILHVVSDVTIVFHFVVNRSLGNRGCLALIEVKRIGAPGSG